MAAPGPNSNNMYRVGDYVYFETSAAGPFAIRRVEELNKTPSGETNFFRRFFSEKTKGPIFVCQFQFQFFFLFKTVNKKLPNSVAILSQ